VGTLHKLTKWIFRKAFDWLLPADMSDRFSHRMDKLHEFEEMHQVSLSDHYPSVARHEPGENRSRGTEK
jgi:hypothetical protein